MVVIAAWKYYSERFFFYSGFVFYRLDSYIAAYGLDTFMGKDDENIGCDECCFSVECNICTETLFYAKYGGMVGGTFSFYAGQFRIYFDWFFAACHRVAVQPHGSAYFYRDTGDCSFCGKFMELFTTSYDKFIFSCFMAADRVVLYRKYDIYGNAACTVDLGNASSLSCAGGLFGIIGGKKKSFSMEWGRRMRTDVIRVENLSKSFSGRNVLNKVSFSCKEGEIIGFVGYNGCGKSVLFKCICGFLKPDSGEIHISLPDGKKNICGNAGIIIEEPAFLRSKSGMKNLEFLYGIRNKSNRKYLEEMMRKVGLEPDNRKSVGHYSLGMRQRLAIAQAIMENPPILILDEPMNGLDKRGVEEMRSLFLKLKEDGKAILMASHNKEDISVLCDRVYEIDGGNLNRIENI